MCLNLAFSAGCFACSACTQCCGATVGESFKQQVRLAYVFFDAIFVGISILLLYWLSNFLEPFALFLNCPSGDPGLSCLGVSAIFRMSFALVVLHAFILFFLFMRNGCSRSFNEEIWMFKVLLVGGVFVGGFFINNEFFGGYSVLAMYVSIFFILFQIVMIIDLCYIWNKTWVDRYDAGQNCYAYLLVLATLIIYGLVIYINVNSYSEFEDCPNGALSVIVNGILCIIGTVLIILGLNPDGSILTSGAVSLYTSYWIWSGMTSVDDPCNTFIADPATSNIQLIVGFFMVILSLIYVSVTAADSSSGKVDVATTLLVDNEADNKKGLNKEDSDDEEDMEKSKKTKKKVDNKRQNNNDNDEEPPKRGKMADYRGNTHINFHLIMLAGSFYIAMLLSNWGAPTNNVNLVVFSASKTATWVKVGTAWFTNVLYIWTIIAPRLFPDRDFS